MTLLLSTIAAVICTILWYQHMADDNMILKNKCM